MSEESGTTKAKAKASQPQASTAPGPITAAHESGSWEQTAKVDEARQALADAQKATAKS